MYTLQHPSIPADPLALPESLTPETLPAARAPAARVATWRNCDGSGDTATIALWLAGSVIGHAVVMRSGPVAWHDSSWPTIEAAQQTAWTLARDLDTP